MFMSIDVHDAYIETLVINQRDGDKSAVNLAMSLGRLGGVTANRRNPICNTYLCEKRIFRLWKIGGLFESINDGTVDIYITIISN
jgi:hypothetical protein